MREENKIRAKCRVQFIRKKWEADHRTRYEQLDPVGFGQIFQALTLITFFFYSVSKLSLVSGFSIVASGFLDFYF